MEIYLKYENELFEGILMIINMVKFSSFTAERKERKKDEREEK